MAENPDRELEIGDGYFERYEEICHAHAPVFLSIHGTPLQWMGMVRKFSLRNPSSTDERRRSPDVCDRILQVSRYDLRLTIAGNISVPERHHPTMMDWKCILFMVRWMLNNERLPLN